MEDNAPENVQLALQLMEAQSEKQQHEIVQAHLLVQTKSRQLEDVTSALHAQIEALQFGQESLADAAAGERLVDDAMHHSVQKQRREKDETLGLFTKSTARLDRSLADHKQTLKHLVEDASMVSRQAEEKSLSFTATVGPLLLQDHEQKVTLMKERVREKSVSELSTELVHEFTEGFSSRSTSSPPLSSAKELSCLSQLAIDVLIASDEVAVLLHDIKKEVNLELEEVLSKHASSSRWLKEDAWGSSASPHLEQASPSLMVSTNTSFAGGPLSMVSKTGFEGNQRHQTFTQPSKAADKIAEENRLQAIEDQRERIKQLEEQVEEKQRREDESRRKEEREGKERHPTSLVAPGLKRYERDPTERTELPDAPEAENDETGPQVSKPSNTHQRVPFQLTSKRRQPPRGTGVVGLPTPFGPVEYPSLTLTQRDAQDLSSSAQHSQQKSSIKKRNHSPPGVNAALLRAMYRELPESDSVREIPRTDASALHLDLRGEVKPSPDQLDAPRAVGGLGGGNKSSIRSGSKGTAKSRLLKKQSFPLPTVVSPRATGKFADSEIKALREHRKWM